MDPDTTPPQVPSQQPVPQQPPQVQPQNFQSSPQIPETEQGDGGSKKTILVVGMIIVFLLLIVGAVGAVLLLSGDEEKNEDTTTTVSQTDEDTTVAEEPADNDDDVTDDNNDDNDDTDDDYTGWQTCSLEDEVLGFYVEMQIPPDWTCTEGQSPQGLKTTTIAERDLDFIISMPLEAECQADNCDEETLYEDDNLEVIRTSWQNPDGSNVGVVWGHFIVDGEPEESYFIFFGEMDLTNQQVETLTPVFESIAFVK